MWSEENPKLQIAWDATSLQSLMKCARRYQYEIIEGWRKSGVDVEFGGFFASAVEVYKKSRLDALDKHAATLEALSYIVAITAKDNTDGVAFWGGRYEVQWHCTGTEPFRNPGGNRAKCPYSKKGAWFEGTGPGTCGSCGSPTETQTRWLPADKYKDRKGLIRLIIGYCDAQPEEIGAPGGLSPYAFPDGTPAVELSFAVPTPWTTKGGQPYILAGHMDSISSIGSREFFITDNKTTKKPMDAGYWSQYSPNVQVDLYDLIGNTLYPDLKLSGVAIEGAQILQGAARFATQPFYRNGTQREEFWGEIEWWLKLAEKYASDDYWPMNRTACFLCSFKSICSKDPGSRQRFLEANFEKKEWNPLRVR